MAIEAHRPHQVTEAASVKEVAPPRGETLSLTEPNHGIQALHTDRPDTSAASGLREQTLLENDAPRGLQLNEATDESQSAGTAVADVAGTAVRRGYWEPSVEEINTGDPAAWSRWAAEATPWVERKLAGYVGVDAAEDMAQEAWEKAYNNREGFEKGNANSWLWTVARNRALDQLRYDKRRKTDLYAPDEMPDPAQRPELNRLSGIDDESGMAARRSPVSVFGDGASGSESSEGGDTVALSAELAERLREAGVKPQFVDALELQLQGKSYDQIGEALGISTGTVRSRINRGRTAVRELAQSPDGGGIFDPDIVRLYAARYEQASQEGTVRMGNGGRKGSRRR